MDLVGPGGKKSTVDIQQSLGASGRYVTKSPILTFSTSSHARDSNESQRDETFVAHRYRPFGMSKLKLPRRLAVASELSTLAVTARSMVES
jgi:hypothetical protein